MELRQRIEALSLLLAHLSEEEMAGAHTLLQAVKERGGTVYTIGNGGSGATASHFSLELLKNCGMKAHALADINLLTAVANDCGYEASFSTPLHTLLAPTDLLMIISASGRSPNLLNAARVAKEKRVKIITLTGHASDNPLRQMGDLNFWLNATETSLVEVAHFFILHTLTEEGLGKR